MRYQLQMYLRRDRLVVIVHCSYVKHRLLSNLDGITCRFNMDAETTIGRQESAPPSYLAIGLIGNSCLHGVVLVLLAATVLVYLYRNSNCKFAIRVQPSYLLGLLICTVCQGVILASLLPVREIGRAS